MFRRYEFNNLEASYKDNLGDSHIVWFGFPSLDVKIDAQKQLVDFNSFVNAIGGGLGLFLGFSLIDTLFHVYQFSLKIK